MNPLARIHRKRKNRECQTTHHHADSRRRHRPRSDQRRRAHPGRRRGRYRSELSNGRSYAVGAEAFETLQGVHSARALHSIERNRVALKGPVTTPIGGGFRLHQRHAAQAIRALRELPPHPKPARPQTRYPGVDLVIVRENTEGFYVGLEHEVVPGVVESLEDHDGKGLHAHREVRLRIRPQASTARRSTPSTRPTS